MEEIDLKHYQLGDRIKSEEDLVWIFEAYHRKIYSYIQYRVNNETVAEDLTSLVFEKVIRGKETYNGSKAPVEVWVFTIAKNCLNNYFREHKKHIWAPLESVIEMISPRRTPEEEALEGEKNSRLKGALNILSERERNIVAMKFWGRFKQ